MKIKWIEFENHQTGLKVDRVDFKDLTLLVGSSGGGKTQILRIIQNLVSFLRSNDINNMQYDYMSNATYKICFAIKYLNLLKTEEEHEGKEDELIWELSTNDDKGTLFIEKEKLTSSLRGEIFTRTRKSIIVKNFEKLPTLAESTTPITTYKDDLTFHDIIFQIVTRVYTINFSEDIQHRKDKMLMKHFGPIIEKTVKSGYPFEEYFIKDFLYLYQGNIFFSLYVIYVAAPIVFEKIQNKYMKIFPEVEEISVKYNSKNDQIEVFIQQNGQTIPEKNISHGMLRTLLYLTYLQILPENSVILIDEVENGLGANCIGHFVDKIVEAENMQFILTSHHPYILNNIPVRSWEVVFLNNSDVHVKNALDLDISDDPSLAFFELLDLIDSKRGFVPADKGE